MDSSVELTDVHLPKHQSSLTEFVGASTWTLDELRGASAIGLARGFASSATAASTIGAGFTIFDLERVFKFCLLNVRLASLIACATYRYHLIDKIYTEGQREWEVLYGVCLVIK